MWNIIEAEEIKPHTLEIMNFVKPRPDYLIIGTGEENVLLDDDDHAEAQQRQPAKGVGEPPVPTRTFQSCMRK